MHWRVPSTGKSWETCKGAPNRKAFKALVETGKATGVLAFQGRTPVGWCSVGPRADYAYLARARKIPPPVSDKTWSIACFFIAKEMRRAGVGGILLRGAVDLARRKKADFPEGYPSAPKPPAARMPDAFAHTGLAKQFEAAGFHRVADAGARKVYRLAL